MTISATITTSTMSQTIARDPTRGRGRRPPGSVASPAGMAVARISRINTTPVKSLRLHHPESVELGPDGALDDRRFLLVDDGRRLYNGKRDTSLVRTTASWDPGSRVLSMTVPSGEAVEDTVVRSRPDVVEVYGRHVRGHAIEGPWADALSDLVGRSLTLIERDDGAWATDSRPATLISCSSVGLLDGVPTPRGAVPSASPDTGCRDRDVLRELLEARGPVDGESCLGVYAEVL